jgi:hypothetical protein
MAGECARSSSGWMFTEHANGRLRSVTLYNTSVRRPPSGACGSIPRKGMTYPVSARRINTERKLSDKCLSIGSLRRCRNGLDWCNRSPCWSKQLWRGARASGVKDRIDGAANQAKGAVKEVAGRTLCAASRKFSGRAPGLLISKMRFHRSLQIAPLCPCLLPKGGFRLLLAGLDDYGNQALCSRYVESCIFGATLLVQALCPINDLRSCSFVQGKELFTRHRHFVRSRSS